MRRGLPMCMLLAACEAPPFEPVCDTRSGPVIGFSTSPSDTVTDEIPLDGYVDSSDDIAIRNVLVAGVEAQPLSYNFRTWTVTLPYDVLLAEAGGDAVSPVSVAVRATAMDACEQEGEALLTVDVASPPPPTGDTDPGTP